MLLSFSAAMVEAEWQPTLVLQFHFIPTHLIPHCVRNDKKGVWLLLAQVQVRSLRLTFLSLLVQLVQHAERLQRRHLVGAQLL